ncbi:MAG: hypothetical protein K2X27_18380, partial [Candidatus Obscuribacterales bacterium]|nr:hypothetical protein [Candidatus Obscuribacterales bacterium]
DSFHLIKDIEQGGVGNLCAFLPQIALVDDLVSNVQNVFSSESSLTKKIASASVGIAEGAVLAGLLL